MITEFDVQACRRLPLAEGVFRLLNYTLDEAFLSGVFQRHRGRSYEKEISFPVFVHLITETLLGHRGSAHQNFLHAIDEDTLPATVQAAFGKLRRVPLSLSLGLVTETFARLQPVLAPRRHDPLPRSLNGFWVLGLDGKKIKYVVKKLQPLRGLKGNIFGAKLLVVEDLRTQQAVGVNALADGEAADQPLVPDAVARVRSLPSKRPRLWVDDRAFCGREVLALHAQEGDHFLTRYAASYTFHPDPEKPVLRGTDDHGRLFTEEWGWLGKPTSTSRVYVRKITVTREGQQPFAVVTSLLDHRKYPAVDLLKVYRKRWGLETMFQQVVTTFDLRHLIAGTAEGTAFQALLCLLLYNITLVIRDGVAGTERQPTTVSVKLLFDDMVRELTAWSKVLGPDATVDLIRRAPVMDAPALRRYLQTILGDVWTDRWNKAPTRTQPPKAPPRAYLRGGHSSVDKIRRGVHHEIPLKIKKTDTCKNAKDPPSVKAKHV
jgi:hypothetical protein